MGRLETRGADRRSGGDGGAAGQPGQPSLNGAGGRGGRGGSGGSSGDGYKGGAKRGGEKNGRKDGGEGPGGMLGGDGAGGYGGVGFSGPDVGVGGHSYHHAMQVGGARAARPRAARVAVEVLSGRRQGVRAAHGYGAAGGPGYAVHPAALSMQGQWLQRGHELVAAQYMMKQVPSPPLPPRPPRPPAPLRDGLPVPARRLLLGCRGERRTRSPDRAPGAPPGHGLRRLRPVVRRILHDPGNDATVRAGPRAQQPPCEMRRVSGTKRARILLVSPLRQATSDARWRGYGHGRNGSSLCRPGGGVDALRTTLLHLLLRQREGVRRHRRFRGGEGGDETSEQGAEEGS